MALEVRYKKRGAPRVRSPRAKAKVSRKKLLFFKGAPETSEAVLDLSASGMKLLARGAPLAKGDKLAVEIAHPSLKETVEVEGLVRWVRVEPGESGRYSAGIEFQDAGEKMREKLERVLAAELGSMVSIGALGHCGYVALGAADQGLDDTLFVYDLERNEIATIRDEKLYLNATRPKDGEFLKKQGAKLDALLRWIFEASKDARVSVEPPIELEPGKSASRA